jgi:VWFA-related protein
MKSSAVPLLAGLASSVWAQTQPEVASHEAPITFSSRVNLVSVPVVVRDRDGKAVGTLRQEDFQLFDKGKLQVITKFSVEGLSIEKTSAAAVDPTRSTTPGQPTPTAAQPVLPDSYVAYLVDDVHLKPGDLLQTRQAMNRHLDEALDRASRAAIFTTSGTMLSDFTEDREQLHKAVNSLQPWTTGPSVNDCPPISYYLADLLSNKFNYFSGLTNVQIAELYFGNGDQAFKDFVTKAQACSGLAITEPPPPPPPPAHPYGDRETSLGLGALKDVIRKLSVMPGSRNLVLVSPGFLLTIDHRTEESDVLERAIRANVTVNTIDMRGLFTSYPAAARTSLSHTGVDDRLESECLRPTADNVLAELADGTGGTFFHNDNDLKGGLNLLAARPEYVYVLGFSPQALKFDGAYHGLKVTVKNSSGLTLQARRGYWAPTACRRRGRGGQKRNPGNRLLAR